MKTYKIAFECEELKNKKWSVISEDYFKIEDIEKKPTPKEINSRVKEILDNWNKTAKPSLHEYPRRLLKIVSVEEIKPKVFKYECDDCDWKGDFPENDKEDDRVEVCPDCGSESLYQNYV